MRARDQGRPGCDGAQAPANRITIAPAGAESIQLEAGAYDRHGVCEATLDALPLPLAA